MQHLPEDGPRRGEEFDGIPTEEEVSAKRRKYPQAAVPIWLEYDAKQKCTFGIPFYHNKDFAERFSPQHYASEWLPCFIKMTHTLTTTTLIDEHITMSISFESDYKKRTSVLKISNLIFDTFSVQHRVHELIFWSLIWECFCRNIQMFVISNPLRVVRQAFLSLAQANNFVFKQNMDLELNLENIKHILSHTPPEIRETGCMKLIKSPLTEINIPRPILAPHDGSAISENYLENLEYFLSRILVTPEDCGDKEYEYVTEVARIIVKFYSKKIELCLFEVRPCFQGLGCGRIILYVLMTYCIENRMASFQVFRPLKPTKHLCQSMGFERIKETTDYVISLDEMKKRALPEQCGLRPGLLRRDETHPGLFRLDRARFPTADQLNDQAAVDARGMCA